MRIKSHLSQQEFGKLWNFKPTTICAYEKGRNTIATPYLYQVCKKYGVSADYLLGRTDEPIYLNNKNKE